MTLIHICNCYVCVQLYTYLTHLLRIRLCDICTLTSLRCDLSFSNMDNWNKNVFYKWLLGRFSRRQVDICLIFSRKQGSTFHEITNPVFWENKKNISICRILKFTNSMISVRYTHINIRDSLEHNSVSTWENVPSYMRVQRRLKSDCSSRSLIRALRKHAYSNTLKVLQPKN